MRDDLATFFRPFVILIFVAVPVLALALPGDWTTRRIWAAAAMYLIGFAILGTAYLFLRSPMGSVPGDTSQWLHHWEAQAWRRYARQHDRRGAGASLTREQLRELQDQHLKAFRGVLGARNTIKFSPAPAGSRRAEHDEELQLAASELVQAAARFRGEVTDADQQSRAIGTTRDELSRLRSVIDRAMSAARNHEAFFAG